MDNTKSKLGNKVNSFSILTQAAIYTGKQRKTINRKMSMKRKKKLSIRTQKRKQLERKKKKD